LPDIFFAFRFPLSLILPLPPDIQRIYYCAAMLLPFFRFSPLPVDAATA